MGDIADAMLDGDLCQCCGVYMEGGAGFPQTCDSCLRVNTEAAQRVVRPMFYINPLYIANEAQGHCVYLRVSFVTASTLRPTGMTDEALREYAKARLSSAWTHAAVNVTCPACREKRMNPNNL